jgi:DNA-directed RNA polymerase sigma subunit (sigma70/sigma32)
MRAAGGDAISAFLNQVAQLPRLSPAQQDALGREAAAGDPLALRSLAQSYLPLVVALSAERRGQGLRFDRLLACGNQALLQGLRLAPCQRQHLSDSIVSALDHALSRISAARSKSL